MANEKKSTVKKELPPKDWVAFLSDRMANYARAAANDPNWKKWNDIVLPTIKKEMAKAL